MAGRIAINPADLEQCAQELTTCATSLIDLAATIKNKYETGTAGFEGNTRDKYAEKFDEYYPVINEKIPQWLEEFSAALKSTAEAWRNLDNA